MAGQGAELVDAGLDVVPGDAFARRDGLDVDGLDDRSVVVDDTVRGLHPQIGLGL